MNRDEALKLALEALEQTLKTLDDENAKPGGAIADTIWYSQHETLFDYLASEITALREALAQPEQEPPPWWPAVENILTEYGLQAIDFVADFKAALAQPEQEPVVCKHEWFRTGAIKPRECRCIKCGAWNTTPPQRTWVGLTDDAEIFAISNTMPYANRFEFARAIEAKLKEKNT